jgi:hypothetical protein
MPAGRAARILREAGPSGAAGQARPELAAELAGGLRRIGARISGTGKKPAAAAPASGTSLTGIFGAGPVVAAIVIGDVRDVSRFAGRDRFAACNGTAPTGVSSGRRTVRRLSRRGNRRLNHAIRMAAVTQVRCPHSGGRACCDKKLAGGKTPEEALRAQAAGQRCRLQAAEGRRRPHRRGRRPGPGGQAGNDSVASAAGLHPGRRLFGQATPGPGPTLRPAPGSREDRAPAGAACRAPPRGRPWPARSSRPQGPAEAPGPGRPPGRRRRRCAAALRPEGRPRTMRGTTRKHSGGEAASISPLTQRGIDMDGLGCESVVVSPPISGWSA